MAEERSLTLPPLITRPIGDDDDHRQDSLTDPGLSVAPVKTTASDPLASPASTSTPSTSPVSSTSSATLSSTTSTSMSSAAPSQVAATDPNTTTAKSGPNVGLIVGLVLGLLVLFALIFFFVRWMYIRRRHQHQESGKRLAYTKAKYAISAPTNFTVVESGTLGADGRSVLSSLSRPGTSMSTLQPSIDDWGNGGTGERAASPDRMRERYPYEAMSGLESGLKNQMQTMKTAQLGRKAVPTITVETETR